MTAAMTGTAGHLRFLGVSALLFVGSAVLIVVWTASMSSMGMPMPGGWTMSMTWMRMPGQSWLGAAATFIGMWVVMMAAMMLPSFVPMLLRYRLRVEAAGGRRLDLMTALAAAGYFGVWTVVGLAAFPLGAGLANLEMRQASLAHAVPLVAGMIVVVAGALQFTNWKAYHLACCRTLPALGEPPRVSAAAAWRHGVQLGLHCSYSSAGLTALLLAGGVMDLRAMAVVMAAITVERLAPAGERIARLVGAVLVAAGVVLIVRAV